MIKALFRFLFTNILVVALVMGLFQNLPDFVTIDGEAQRPLIQRDNGIESQNLLTMNLNFWKGVFLEDFGVSRYGGDLTIGALLRRHGGSSFQLWALALFISGFLGFTLGVLSGGFEIPTFKFLLRFGGLFFSSLPSFFLVPLLVYFFSIRWRLFPPALWEGPRSAVLPLTALTLRPSFLMAQIFSERLMEVKKMSFIKTARAKGLSRFRILLIHLIPNSALGLLIVFGNLFGQMIASLILVESMFALPGLGGLFLKSIAERDYPLLVALVLIFSLVLQLGHRFADYFTLRRGRVNALSQGLEN